MTDVTGVAIRMPMGDLSHYAQMCRNRPIPLHGTGKPVPYAPVVKYPVYRGGFGKTHQIVLILGEILDLFLKTVDSTREWW